MCCSVKRNLAEEAMGNSDNQGVLEASLAQHHRDDGPTSSLGHVSIGKSSSIAVNQYDRHQTARHTLRHESYWFKPQPRTKRRKKGDDTLRECRLGSTKHT